jgi:hypothetical protein
VHRAHRLLSESTLILRTLRKRPSPGSFASRFCERISIEPTGVERHRLQNPSCEKRVKTFAIRNLGAAPFCFLNRNLCYKKLLGSKAVASVLGARRAIPGGEVFRTMKQRAGIKVSLAALPSRGIRKTRNGESFGKYDQTVLTDAVNYRVLRTRKNRKITS